MSAENKTHEQIVAEVRFHAQQNIDAEKDKPEFGILTAEGRIALNYADELEAAHKREVEKLNSVIQATVSRSDAEIDRLRREAEELGKKLGNAVKLREAVKAVVDVGYPHNFQIEAPHIRGYCYEITEAIKKCFAALAAPVRNCDRFTNLHDAWLAWQAHCAEHMEDPTMKKFQVWLYDTAKEAV